MITSHQSKRADARCRTAYRLIASQCKRRGLDTEEIERSRKELNSQVDFTCQLSEIAYKPTGMALGCPIPDRSFTRRLWRISRLVEEYLAKHSVDEKPSFAFVPPLWYHITVANRTHFDFNAADLMARHDHVLSQEERRSAQAVVSQIAAGPLLVQFSGLILTSSGRLLVPGFPADDRLYEVRYQLADSLPQVRVNLPTTAHIKLGHILLDLKNEQMRSFLNWLPLCGQHISARVAFSDLYTPAGRIVL
jgi:hypothetical protein